METPVNVWNELIYFLGGALETRKCVLYILQWTSNGKGKITLQQTKEILVIDTNGTKICSKQLDPATLSTYLEVTSQPNELQERQTQILISPKIITCSMSHYLAQAYYQNSIKPKFGCPLIASFLFNNQIYSIKTIIYPNVIA